VRSLSDKSYLFSLVTKYADDFIARVCTVIELAPRKTAVSTLFLKEEKVSPGSPAIRSIFILSKPHFFASSNASTVWCDVWRLPIVFKTSSLNVCGFIDILPTLAFFNAISLSCVTVSGLPASTVYSRKADKSKLSLITSKSFLSCEAERVVGVPPPKYIVSRRKPSCFAICPVFSSSLQRRLT